MGPPHKFLFCAAISQFSIKMFLLYAYRFSLAWFIITIHVIIANANSKIIPLSVTKGTHKRWRIFDGSFFTGIFFTPAVLVECNTQLSAPRTATVASFLRQTRRRYRTFLRRSTVKIVSTTQNSVRYACARVSRIIICVRSVLRARFTYSHYYC